MIVKNRVSPDDEKFLKLKVRLAPLFDKAIKEGVFPGAVAAVAVGSGCARKTISLTYGDRQIYPEPKPVHHHVFYDLASLTKPLATTLTLLHLIKGKKICLDETLYSLLEQEAPRDKREISLRHLLCHASGLPAHRPFFSDLIELKACERAQALTTMILKEPLLAIPGSVALYSDLGFMLAGRIIEIKTGKKIDTLWREKIISPLNLTEGLFFHPVGSEPKKGIDFAGTERCPRRGKVLCGEVHDDNAYALGGVAGHAGLFGDIGSLLLLLCRLLDCWKERDSHPGFNNKDLKYFFTRQNVVPGSTWALGFDTPSPQGSSGGSYISPLAVGHLGFTGTSFWIDPEREAVIVLLSNRVHPERENERIKIFRPLFHDAVFAELCNALPRTENKNHLAATREAVKGF